MADATLLARASSPSGCSPPAAASAFRTSLYFLLGGAVTRFHMLKYGLALVLIFVGVKMAWLNDLWAGKFPITWSLGIIGALIGASVLLSLVVAPPRPATRPTCAAGAPGGND